MKKKTKLKSFEKDEKGKLQENINKKQGIKK